MAHEISNFLTAVNQNKIEEFEKLASSGVSVNMRTSNNRTLLHELCRRSRFPDQTLPFIKILINYNADVNIKDDDNLTPIQFAAVEYNKIALDYLSLVETVNSDSLISAFELYGSQVSSKEAATTYWTKAQLLRSKYAAGKYPTCSEQTENYIFPDVIEISDIDNLTDVVEDVEKRCQQSIVFLDKHLGRHSLHTLKQIEQLMHLYDRYNSTESRSAASTRIGFVLCQILKVKQPLFVDKAKLNLFNGILWYWCIFFGSKSNVNYSDIKEIFPLLIDQLRMLGEVNENESKNGVESVLHLIGNVIALAVDMEKTADDNISFSGNIRYLVEVDKEYSSDFGLSILHVMIKNASNLFFPSEKNSVIEIINLFFGYGLSVNVLDRKKNTPLHILLNDCRNTRHIDTVKFLLHSGAHVDARNKSGVTALQLLRESNIDVCEVKYRSLQCLAASCIQQYGVQYSKNVPESLKSFIDTH